MPATDAKVIVMIVFFLLALCLTISASQCMCPLSTPYLHSNEGTEGCDPSKEASRHEQPEILAVTIAGPFSILAQAGAEDGSRSASEIPKECQGEDSMLVPSIFNLRILHTPPFQDQEHMHPCSSG